MRSRIGTILAAAVLVEILAVLLLIVLVVLRSPADEAAAQQLAQEMGLWVGPLGGFLLSLLAGYWVASRAAGSPVTNGLWLGLAAAAIDVALLLAGGAGFEPIFLMSNLGRVVAGTLGGWWAGRSASPAES